MMKVLHYFQKNDPLSARYVALLTTALKDVVHQEMADHLQDFNRLLRQFAPDIVHLHGAVDCPRCNGSVRLVCTPNGAGVVHRQAYLTFARSKAEADRLAEAGQKRISVVKNPLITKTMSVDELVRKLTESYQRVMDTDVLSLMDDDTRTALRILLKAAITGDRRWVEVAMPSSVQWRQLYIYAENEGVLPQVKRGCQVMGIEQPGVESVQGLLPEHFEMPVNMTGNSIFQLLEDVREHGPSLLRLVEIDQALRNERLDEDKLLEELENRKLNVLFKSVLRLLVEQTMLDEGFWPCAPSKVSEARKLREELYRRQQIF